MRRVSRIKAIMLVVLYVCTLQVQATEKDSIQQKKNLRFSILGGPGYTPDYGLVIGGSCLFTFSTNVADTTMKRSVLPVAFAYMTNGGGSMIVRPQLFFNEDRFRIFGQFSMNSTLDNYYGVGYETNSSTDRGEKTTQYRSVGFKMNPIFLFRYSDTNLFLGASIDAGKRSMEEPSEGVINDPHFIAQGGTTEGLSFTNVGIGANISYDTRDIPANAYSGMFVEVSATYYPKAIGSTMEYGVYKLDYRQFRELKMLGERRVLAWMLNGRFTSGDVPITEMSLVGSPFDLRGYYLGHYRDRNALMSVVEYRHMFNAGDETRFRRLLSKCGFVTWGGVGSVSDKFMDSKHLLPNYGAGLRIEVQPRMNFRLDVGRDPTNKQNLIYFNMTEAF
ncbi:BamA/TamA family outer membrane protein [Carboxylicivirga sediminis]|uniref:BamA/TamA family outer membrane protein n=1 Tax=Carboxylicivirga sediminis TaxID=2006564 RepID=A0A941IXW4_9BACT|nr:BamA/TamA family outer membrane protein [Carboxylicivirga sediminis]MBR8536370.1 BamA/TamA family outer membrane protein [Carboxylicivirga sediminis]